LNRGVLDDEFEGKRSKIAVRFNDVVISVAPVVVLENYSLILQALHIVIKNTDVLKTHSIGYVLASLHTAGNLWIEF
jgi:hypothetical protein